MTFTPTPEQETARSLFLAGGSLAIQAGAGTGKTSTLRLLAESDMHRRGQYVAFNKAIVKDSARSMPGTVTCSTAHSLAFRAVGRQYRSRLDAPRMSSMELARRLKMDPLTIETPFGKKVLQPGYLASLTMRAVVRFCQTADLAPSKDHVPYVDGIDLPTEDGRRTYGANREVRLHLEPAILRAWKDISDVNGSLPFRHDHYLKLWQLSGPRIPADFILFDEAQDANPVMVAAVAAQEHAQLVFVGDSQQQIYEFTGAVDALDSVPAESTAYLSQSFRFGPDVAGVANRVLGMIPGAALRLKGTDSIASVVGPVAQPDVVLTRTNATAVDTVLSAQRAGGRPCLVGGGDEVRRFAEAAADLMNERPTTHPELACFETWGQVQDYVEQDPQGSELAMLVRLVDSYGTDVIADALGRMPSEAGASVIVSTAHKAKGREWGSVQLAGDFCPPPKDTADDEQYDASASELRLLYVAVTRARFELDETKVKLFSPERTRRPAPKLPDA